MNTWFRKVGMGAFAVTLVGVMAGCNNGNGGATAAALVKLFFGINGKGTCSNYTVSLDLNKANAVIARDAEGFVKCALNSQLEKKGCDFSVTETEGELTATISDCNIPAVTNLFNCSFEEVDIDLLYKVYKFASSQCECTTENCLGEPPVCISKKPDPTSCEICNNGKDDDGNDLEDCEDPNCDNSPFCGVTTTSVSVPSSTQPLPSTSVPDTTVTSSTVTTTNTIAPPLTCTVIFNIPNTNLNKKIGGLKWVTDYDKIPGFLKGSGTDIDCAALAGGSNILFNDDDSTRSFTSGLISVGGVTAPTDVSECRFLATAKPTVDDFVINVTEAVDNSDDQLNLDPAPTVIVKSIECTEPPVTTTTLPDVTTTVPSSGSSSSTSSTSTVTATIPAATYSVTFRLDSAALKARAVLKVSALAVSVNYTNAPGDFDGTADSVSCTQGLGSASGSLIPNDIDAQRELTFGLINATGFTVPVGGIDIVTCDFTGNSATAPQAADFVVTSSGTDSSDEGLELTVPVSVKVTAK